MSGSAVNVRAIRTVSIFDGDVHIVVDGERSNRPLFSTVSFDAATNYGNVAGVVVAVVRTPYPPACVTTRRDVSNALPVTKRVGIITTAVCE